MSAQCVCYLWRTFLTPCCVHIDDDYENTLVHTYMRAYIYACIHIQIHVFNVPSLCNAIVKFIPGMKEVHLRIFATTTQYAHRRHTCANSVCIMYLMYVYIREFLCGGSVCGYTLIFFSLSLTLTILPEQCEAGKYGSTISLMQCTDVSAFYVPCMIKIYPCCI
jgi:hypothetical protein